MKVFQTFGDGTRIQLVPTNKNGKIIYTSAENATRAAESNTTSTNPGAISKLKSFLKSGMSSQTLTEVSDELAELRLSSCRACPHFVLSQTTPDHHICNKCGCGERKILEIAVKKLPYLECPLKRPGFSNEEK